MEVAQIVPEDPPPLPGTRFDFVSSGAIEVVESYCALDGNVSFVDNAAQDNGGDYT